MNRIDARFEALRARGRKALVPFITAGDPHPGLTVRMMHALVDGGADIIELGVPFSDPMADGPVIQRASERALAHHTRLADVLEMVRTFRTRDNDTPVVLMGYLNPVEAMGYKVFAQSAADAGVDGILTVDCPPEEGSGYLDALRGAGLHPIFLLAPTSTDERIAKVTGAANGFVYYVSLKGVTGAGHLDTAAVAVKLKAIRTHTTLPVGVGFGIKDADTAASLAATADAIVVGSAIVSRVEALGEQPDALVEELRSFVAGLRDAIDGASAAA